jgi:hypothetical protein
MLDAALDALPEWCDRDSSRKSMTRLARKNLTQAHLSRLTGQVEKRYYDGRYSAVPIRQPLCQYIPRLERKSMVPDFG